MENYTKNEIVQCMSQQQFSSIQIKRNLYKNEWWRAFEQVYFIHQKEAKRDLIWGINWGGGGEETEMLYQKSFSFGLKSIFHDL